MTSDLVYTIDQKKSGLLASPDLSEGPIGQPRVVQSGSHIVGNLTSFEFIFTISDAIPANGYMRFYFPSNAVYLTAPATPICLDQLANNSPLNCSATLYSGNTSVWYI
jgi:hypothetical protein